MARRSSSIGKGRSLRDKRRVARPAEDEQIKAVEALLRNLKTAQAVKDRGARDYYAANARLKEMELFDKSRRAAAGHSRVTQAYLEAFAITVAWRFLSESMGEGRFMAPDGALLVADYLAARSEIVRTYLEHRFPPDTPTVTTRMIDAAVYCAGKRAGNYQVTAMLGVTKAEHDAHGFSQLKWSDEPEDVVKAELQRRKNEARKATLAARRRAAGKPTRAERSTVSVKALADHFSVSTKTIRNWARLGELSGKLDHFPPASPYKEWRELSGKLEAAGMAGRASSPTPPEPISHDEPPVSFPSIPVPEESAPMHADQRLADLTVADLSAVLAAAAQEGVERGLAIAEEQRRATETARAERDKRIKATIGELALHHPPFSLHIPLAWAALEQDVPAARIASVFAAMGPAGLNSPARPYDRDRIVAMLTDESAAPEQVAAMMLGRPIVMAQP